MNADPIIRRTTVALMAVVVTAGLTGCKTERVCSATPERIMVVASTSTSDLKTARELTPAVTGEAAARASESCGLVGAGIAGNRVESDMVVELKQLEPARTTAPNRRPDVRKMLRAAERFYDQKLLEPLANVTATSGSPFLGALAKVAAELEAEGLSGGTVVAIVGDGIDIEGAPSGKKIDFRSHEVDRRALDEFVPLLRPLSGSCVALLGAGARSNADPVVLRRSRKLLGGVLSKANVDFVATRSSRLPNTCRASP